MPHSALHPMNCLSTYNVEITEFAVEKCLQGRWSNVEIWSSKCLDDLWHHVGQSTENPLVQFTEVRIQSSRNFLNANSCVFAGLPYLVTEQPVHMALLYVKADEVTFNVHWAESEPKSIGATLCNSFWEQLPLTIQSQCQFWLGQLPSLTTRVLDDSGPPMRCQK